MVQTKIFGLRSQLAPIRQELSEVVHACVVDALAYPKDKRMQRFFLFDREDFFYPAGRTDRYTIIEFVMFTGRSTETKKRLLRLLFERVQRLGISEQDLEITIFEQPKHHWGFRGLPGDEHQLSYQVEM
ncbi:4-oxalocrotonate tautomerase [Thalassoporum mexicanum PCC 7367]|uniref:tautomerase family protein n=1 Tax=Thalassoporum mexicanum TaxID=3457544 RepID=UPI00029FF802|nr:tautomerase family protein [Pseudanabaena sp. PCC 7367]AFY71525.1 4-oxalocrotonate tautomerase [Pseudanabaena sp. PCC 7367]